jgi:hypothetical protein
MILHAPFGIDRFPHCGDRPNDGDGCGEEYGYVFCGDGAGHQRIGIGSGYGDAHGSSRFYLHPHKPHPVGSPLTVAIILIHHHLCKTPTHH